MLMIEIFTILGEAYRGVSLLVEGIMIAAAQVAVETKNEQRLYSKVIGGTNLCDVARQFPRRRIAFAAERTNLLELFVIGGDGHALGKHAHHPRSLPDTCGPAHNVVVQHGKDVPSPLLRHLRKVAAAVQSLLFAGDGEKDDRRA